MNLTRYFKSSVALLAVFGAMTAASTWAFEGPKASPEKERELLSVLRSDAPPADKALACKNLAVHGSSEAVPELAKLLADAQLASWARIPLEVIPGTAADAALRKAVDSLSGILLVGTINSIGVRRDSEAVDLLSARLQDKDPEVASAAAVALGHIGNAAAAKSLRLALKDSPSKVRSAVGEGCVLCAERLMLDQRDAAGAVEIYDEIRKAEVPKQRILEATRGAILARKPEAGIALLVEQLHSPDISLFQIALSTAREFPGNKIDEALAAELAHAKPEQAALVILAMADRKETVLLPAVLKAAEAGPKQVRLAAIGALGRVGNATCVSSLLEVALDADPELALAAKSALGDLPGESVDNDIVARIPKAEGKTYPLLIELVGQRRIDAIADLLKAVSHSDKAVRNAALASLGTTVPAKSLSVLVTLVVTPQHAEDLPVAQLALKTACIRMPDREACAGELASALDGASGPTKIALMEILSEVGGTKALQTLAAAAKSTDPQLQDTSSRLLGGWDSIDAAPVLLDLAKTAPGEKYQVRALRGYISIARRFAMPEPQRAQMCEQAFAVARQSAEKKLLLEVAKKYPSLDMLKVAVKVAQIPELKNDATPVVLAVAQKVGPTPEVKELLTQLGLDKTK